MRSKLLIMLIGVSISAASMAQSTERSAIEKTVRTFAKAGETQNVQLFEKTLNANYQVVMNRLFGSEETVILSRADYLQKIETKEFGGEKRKVTIEHIEVNGTSAVAKVLMEGEKISFRSLLVLVQKPDGRWEIISDIPTVV